MYFRLKPLFSSIEKYDEEGTGPYSTKLEALMDPDTRYDILRQSLLQPARDAEHMVADAIYAVQKRFDSSVGGNFASKVATAAGRANSDQMAGSTPTRKYR